MPSNIRCSTCSGKIRFLVPPFQCFMCSRDVPGLFSHCIEWVLGYLWSPLIFPQACRKWECPCICVWHHLFFCLLMSLSSLHIITRPTVYTAMSHDQLWALIGCFLWTLPSVPQPCHAASCKSDWTKAVWDVMCLLLGHIALCLSACVWATPDLIKWQRLLQQKQEHSQSQLI